MTTHPNFLPAAGSEIKARRNALGWSYQALGQRAGGIASASVYRLEKGIVRPNPSTLAALDRALTAGERAARRKAARRPENGSSSASQPSSTKTDVTSAGHDPRF